jgi:hypothetical protein
LPKITGWPGAGHSSADSRTAQQPQNVTAEAGGYTAERAPHGHWQDRREWDQGNGRGAAGRRPHSVRLQSPTSSVAESSAHLAQIKDVQQVRACSSKFEVKQRNQPPDGGPTQGSAGLFMLLVVAGRAPGYRRCRATGPHSDDNSDQDHGANVRWQSGTTITGRLEPAEPRVDSQARQWFFKLDRAALTKGCSDGRGGRQPPRNLYNNC